MLYDILSHIQDPLANFQLASNTGKFSYRPTMLQDERTFGSDELSIIYSYIDPTAMSCCHHELLLAL